MDMINMITDLEKQLVASCERSTTNRKMIVTDGVFSMDGDICKLRYLSPPFPPSSPVYMVLVNFSFYYPFMFPVHSHPNPVPFLLHHTKLCRPIFYFSHILSCLNLFYSIPLCSGVYSV